MENDVYMVDVNESEENLTSEIRVQENWCCKISETVWVQEYYTISFHI